MPRKDNPIARFAVDRRVTMGMAVIGVLVLGWVSLGKLPLEFLPSFSSSSIWVQVPYASTSPEEVERLIVRPLEESLGTINGIETLSARAQADSGSVSIGFLDGTDMDLAAVEVRDRIDRVRHRLPSDVRRVFVRRFQSTDIPVYQFHLGTRADWDPDRLYDVVENLVRRRLERLEGVAQVDVSGLRQRQVQVELNPARLGAHGLDVRRVAELLRENNVNVSGGHIREGSQKFLVRTVGELVSVDEIGGLPLNGRGLRLADVADVKYTFPRQENFSFLNGREALTISIYKASTANLLAVVDRVKAELGTIARLPQAQGIAIRDLRDASVDVRQGLTQLGNAGMVGGALAIFFLFLFLRKVRTTLLVAIAIPVSVVVAFVIMYLVRTAGWSDITLNIISLMGLMLALGMLVDNSVVVIEAIFRRYQELGEDARTAALRGTSEVAMPILASTLTTICVFMPLVFLAQSGRGFTRFMLDAGSTICMVMTASLVVALTVVPMLAAILLRGESPRPSPAVRWLVGQYGKAIGFTLRHRGAFLLMVVGLLYASWTMFQTVERRLTPRSVERQVTLHVDTPRAYSFEQTEALYKEIGNLLQQHEEELDIADVVYRYNRRGGRSRGGFGGGNRFDLYLVDEEVSTLGTREVQDRLRSLLPVKAGVQFRIGQSRTHMGSGAGIELEVTGDDMVVLELVSQRVAAALAELDWVRDVDTSLESGEEEIHVRVERTRALQAGLSSQAVAFTVANALSTRPVSRLKTENREVDMVMQFREEDRRTLTQLKTLPVFAASSALPIDAVADFALERGPRTIERENRRPKVSITANTVEQGTSFGMMGEVQSILSTLSLPPGYEWSFGRWTRNAQQDFSGARFALLFAVALIFLIMAALFEDFLQPLTIMLSIPFAFIGVGIVLKLTNQPLDNVANLGLVILAGVVVNNAIVLIDHINHLRWEGMDRNEAIVLGGRHRLRPILMTALTTIFGLVPMVAPLVFPGWLGSVEGRAGNWAPVGLVILGGLTTSTFLTLLVAPTIYSFVDDFSAFARRVIRAA